MAPCPAAAGAEYELKGRESWGESLLFGLSSFWCCLLFGCWGVVSLG